MPLIVRWPGRIPAGVVENLPSAFWDVLPTLTELAGARTPDGVDGVSLAPTLLGRPDEQEQHDYLYWEFSQGQAVRLGDWKGIRPNPDADLELYDIGEAHDLAADRPDIVAEIAEVMRTGRTESVLFPLRRAG